MFWGCHCLRIRVLGLRRGRRRLSLLRRYSLLRALLLRATRLLTQYRRRRRPAGPRYLRKPTRLLRRRRHGRPQRLRLHHHMAGVAGHPERPGAPEAAPVAVENAAVEDQTQGSGLVQEAPPGVQEGRQEPPEVAQNDEPAEKSENQDHHSRKNNYGSKKLSSTSPSRAPRHRRWEAATGRSYSAGRGRGSQGRCPLFKNLAQSARPALPELPLDCGV